MYFASLENIVSFTVLAILIGSTIGSAVIFLNRDKSVPGPRKMTRETGYLRPADWPTPPPQTLTVYRSQPPARRQWISRRFRISVLGMVGLLGLAAGTFGVLH